MGSIVKGLLVIIVFALLIILLNPNFLDNNQLTNAGNQIQSNIPSSIQRLPNNIQQLPNSVPYFDPNAFRSPFTPPQFPQALNEVNRAAGNPIYVAQMNIKFTAEYIQETTARPATIRNAGLDTQIMTFTTLDDESMLVTELPPLPTRTQKEHVVLYIVATDNFESKSYFSKPVMILPLLGKLEADFTMFLPAGANYQLLTYSSTGFNGIEIDFPLIYSISV